MSAERELRISEVRAALAARRSSGSGSGGTRSVRRSRDADDGTLLSDRDLREIERQNPEGVTSVQVVELFARSGIRFSEATFRKYVQLGLLPRSRRVGRKGKHQGSMGLYPAKTVRRINTIKRLMAQSYTIEEIQKQFLRFRDEIEALEQGLESLFGEIESAARAPHFDTQAKKDLKREVADAKKTAEDLIRRLEEMERRICEPGEGLSGKPAPEGAEDLL